MNTQTVAAVILAAVLVGLLPSLIALARRHPNTVEVVALNLGLGWTVVGWIVALAWSIGPAGYFDYRDDTPRP